MSGLYPDVNPGRPEARRGVRLAPLRAGEQAAGRGQAARGFPGTGHSEIGVLPLARAACTCVRGPSARRSGAWDVGEHLLAHGLHACCLVSQVSAGRRVLRMHQHPLT